MMKALLVLTITFISFNCLAQFNLVDMQKLHNDKEVIVSSFKASERKRILSAYGDEKTIKEFREIFEVSMLGYLNQDVDKCELGLVNILRTNLQKKNISTQKEISDFLKALRVHHTIDDILYELLFEINNDYYGLSQLDLSRKGKRLILEYKKLMDANDLEEVFSGINDSFETNPSCFLQEYNRAFNKVLGEDGRPSQNLKHFKRLTTRAYEKKIIDLPTFQKIRYLQTESKINDRTIWLNDYLRIIFNAKNKMVPLRYSYKPLSIEDEDDFASERIKRFSRITRRKLLYRKYDETQIILLSQVLQKASRRMGVDADTESGRPYISQEFTVMNPDGGSRTYVETIELDPQSQYNLARRLLRKDVVDLQMMDLFVKQKITHEDVVMAALETGYISLEELEHVVRYDDLWNPLISKYQRISGFIFTVAGYSTFFLPPPWNITASIALGVVDGIVNNKFKTGAENDNPATFIE